MKITTHTPEGISFQTTLAGPTTRFLAWVIDAIAIQTIVIALWKILVVFIWIAPDSIGGFFVVASFATSTGYSIALEWLWKGQTIGKRILRLQVMDESALPLSFSQVFIRNVLRVVDSLPILYLVGGAAAFLTPKSQRLGDIAARTIVARREKPKELNFKQVASGKFNSLKPFSRECAKLRQAVLPEEAGLALQSLIRRDSLEDRARIQLFKRFRERMTNAVTFPEEATLGLSDEQFVRNALEILFENRGSR